MEKAKQITPFRLSSLLRLQKDPNLAFQLFFNPNPNPNDPNPKPKPFRYSPLSYDLIITKLGRAKLFNQLEKVIEKLRNDTRITPKEIIFCNIIQYYGRARLPEKALQMFDQIPEFRCNVTIKSFNSLLNSLLMCREFDRMRQVYNSIEKFDCPDVCTYNILINSWCLRGDFGEAWNLFDEMKNRGVEPNVVTFGTLINGLCANLRLTEAFELKKQMIREFKLMPNAFVYVALMKGLCGVGKVNEAIKLKNEMLKVKIELDSAVYATLISALFKDGRKEEAYKLLEEMKENGHKLDTITCNAMIYGFCVEKDFESAFKYLDKMGDKWCKPDVISYNVIIRGLCGEGRLKEAIDLFEDMPRRRCVPDVVTYRILFDGLYEGLQYEEAAFILDEMVFKGHFPRSASLNKFVDRLIQEGKVELLWTVLNSLAKGNIIDIGIWRTLILMLCKEEKLSNAFGVIDTLVLE